MNPRSGGDVRRAVAAAARSTLEDKVSIVRRIVLGSMAAGVTTFHANYEPMQIVRRATETIRDINIVYVNDSMTFTEEDSTIAARLMKDNGVPCVAVLGGDGTNRAVTKGWMDIPVIPISTGTNNAFPVFIEPTVAGTALGLVSTGAVGLEDVSDQSKLIHVANHEGDIDLALIDAVAVDDPYVGSLELFDPETMVLAILTQADPIAIGFSSVGGLLQPVTGEDDHALLVRFAPIGSGRDEIIIKAPTAPAITTVSAYKKSRRFLLMKQLQWMERSCWLLMVNVNCVCVKTKQFIFRSSRWPQVIDPARAVTLGRSVMINP